MLEQAKDASDYTPDKGYHIKGLLTGESGSGKTTGTMSLPGKKLLIDLDGRAESVAGFPDLRILKILEPNAKKPTAWEELNEVLNDLWEVKDECEESKDPFPYTSIIIDGLTMAGRYAMNWVMEKAITNDGKKLSRGPGGSPSQPHYQPQMTMFAKTVLGFIPLPCHIVFTSHLDLYQDKQLGTLKYYPKVIGNTRTEVSNWFNETYECVREEGSNGVEYQWNTVGIGRTGFIKSSLNALGKYWDDPIVVDFDKEPVGFQKLLDIRFKKGGK